MRILKTLAELKLFCKEQGLQYFQGKERGFIITLSKIDVVRYTAYSSYQKLDFDVKGDTVIISEQVSSIVDNGEVEITSKTFSNVIAVFTYDKEELLLVFKTCENYWEECTAFHLADGDKK